MKLLLIVQLNHQQTMKRWWIMKYHPEEEAKVGRETQRLGDHDKTFITQCMEEDRILRVNIIIAKAMILASMLFETELFVSV